MAFDYTPNKAFQNKNGDIVKPRVGKQKNVVVASNCELAKVTGGSFFTEGSIVY